MFDLKRPCSKCPFRRGQGAVFQLPPQRLKEIFNATAFQCHCTVEYGEDKNGNESTFPGEKPQQCAGLMALLHREEAHNAIMKVAIHTGHLDCSQLDPKREAYESFADAKRAHAGQEPEAPRGDAPYCEACKRHATLKRGDEVYFTARYKHVRMWVCPGCDSRVGCHKNTTKPLGSLASEKLRKARVAAHAALDPLWQKGSRSRNEVYRWLGSKMQLKPKQCHIGLFTEAQCEQVIQICRERHNQRGTRE